MAHDDDATRASESPDSGNDDTIPAVSSHDEPRAQVLPSSKRYRLGAELGRGGMGRVVEAFDLQLGRTVAFKEVPANRASAGVERRFAREVQITARLEHPAIVPLYDSGVTEDGRPFYVMRKVTGRPLDDLIGRSRSVADRMAQLPAVLAAIDAVGHAHRRGVIHRDLKPANILVGELGETIVIDWGLAKVIGEESDEVVETVMPSDSLHTQLGSVFGTPGFMAPEQARGEELGPRGDVYALGATLYQLLAGKPPHKGTSATEVLSSTMSKAVDPAELAELGAPPDLVAIVKKALAFEAADRYPDAVALGEDVRRFLAGQLVAAHQYTRRQRLARFAKKYRGALAVAAVASIAVAGLAWYGVHRILTERDIADEARRVAILESQTSKERLSAVQDRDERRTVANARALVATNPTAAVATLKQLPAGSKYSDEARTVAQSAVARGVVWGQQTTTAYTIQALLSPDGSKLFQLTNDTWVRLWDLDRHKLVWQRHERDAHARFAWLADGKHLLVRHDAAPPELVDALALTGAPLPIAVMRDAVAAEHADVVLYVDADGAVHRLEVGANTDVVLPVEHLGKRDDIAIAPDGRSFAVTDGATRVIAFAADGTELARHDGAFHTLAFSTTGRLAAFGVPETIELHLAPPRTWTEVPLGDQLKHGIARGGYIGDELQIAVGQHVYGWRDRLIQRMETGTSFIGGFAIAGGLVVAELTDARLRYANRYESGEIALPMSVPGIRLLGRPDLSRLVIVGQGVLLDLPIDNFAAKAIPKPRDETPVFVADDALLYLPSAGDTLRWFETTTERSTLVQLEKPGMHLLKSVDERGGRALITDMFGNVNGAHADQAPTRLLLAKRGEATVRTIAEDNGLWGVLVDGGVVYSDAKGKLWGARGDEPVRELATLSGGVMSIVGRGKLGFAAYTDKGELVRGTFDRIEDRAFTRATDNVHLAVDLADRVYIAIGSRLSRWDGDVHELADFGKPITSLMRGAGGLIVGLDGGEFLLLPVDPDGPAKRVLSVGSTNVEVGDRGKLLMAFGQSRSLELVELPARIRWSIPVTMSTHGHVTLSPSARTLVYEPELGSEYSLVRTLTTGPTDLPAWLDELTNATADEGGFVVWPWQ